MTLRRLVSLLLVAVCLVSAGGSSEARPPRPGERDTYSSDELVDSGHKFFGNVSRGLALAMEEAIRRWGEPDAYILGQEGGGAFIGGLRYGEGRLFTRHGRGERIFWQGPSVGFDFGGEGARSMMLVYNLGSTPDLFQRFVEVDGSAYLIAGVGMTAARAPSGDTVVVPIRTGVGLRLGVNIGYLKFTDAPTWNPF